MMIVAGYSRLVSRRRITPMPQEPENRMDRLEAMQEKTQIMLAPIVDSIQRLERIALSHEVRVQDVEEALAKLEGRTRKPQ
jgi:DNA-binding TFAR19-related protein (PDSD5 family)